MVKEKSNAEKKELPAWYQPAMTLGIPATSALIGTPPYTALKQIQNNKQLGTTESVFAFKGIQPTAAQMLLRIISRVGPVPAVQAFAKNNHPKSMSDETAKNAATIASLTAGDIINTPTELMSTKQQTWKQSSGLPKPSFTQYWKDSSSAPNFVGKLYGVDGNLRGAPALSVAFRTTPFLFTLIMAQAEINKQLKPEGFQQKMASSIAAGAMGVLVSALITPLSAVQQQTMRFDNPKNLPDAFKTVLGNGIKNAFKGVGARSALSAVGAGMTLGALAGQEALENHVKGKNR